MSKAQDKKIAAIIEALPQQSFTNEHGEKFTLYSSGTSVYMSGDEVNAMVDNRDKIAGKYIVLFSAVFSVWSKDELRLLGKALVELHDA